MIIWTVKVHSFRMRLYFASPLTGKLLQDWTQNLQEIPQTNKLENLLGARFILKFYKCIACVVPVCVFQGNVLVWILNFKTGSFRYILPKSLTIPFIHKHGKVYHRIAYLTLFLEIFERIKKKKKTYVVVNAFKLLLTIFSNKNHLTALYEEF